MSVSTFSPLLSLASPSSSPQILGASYVLASTLASCKPSHSDELLSIAKKLSSSQTVFSRTLTVSDRVPYITIIQEKKPLLATPLSNKCIKLMHDINSFSNMKGSINIYALEAAVKNFLKTCNPKYVTFQFIIRT